MPGRANRSSADIHFHLVGESQREAVEGGAPAIGSLAKSPKKPEVTNQIRELKLSKKLLKP
jgi:hypothetical protein